MRISVGIVAAVLGLAVQGAFAISNDFSSNPLTDSSNIIQGPDAANVGNRFTYNVDDQTLTAHYDTAAPTIKLLFPLGQTYTQNTSFQLTATFEISANNFVIPSSFGGQVPSFGLVNSVTTGDQRASSYDQDFNEIPGTAYDIMTFDYFPTQDNTWDGNSINLTTIQTDTGLGFNKSFGNTVTNYANTSLPFDTFITVTLTYDADTMLATLDWGSGTTIVADLTGDVFSVDSFAITLWNDPGIEGWGDDPTSGDIVFKSFSVTSVPEPASLGLLAAGALLMATRRRR
ncbi:MAG: PEP-CTERM sorting domain-containing protein [Phycisphaerales bacterium]|nr:PEP-CTERM sorting domain-containing protein [Phycisphaerales bacterium]